MKWYVIFSKLSFYLIMIVSVSFCRSSTGKKNSDEQQKMVLSKTIKSSDGASDTKDYPTIPADSEGSFQYNLDTPEERYILPKHLKEISGLAFYEENKILCEQDEKADIYVFNLDRKEIVDKYNFGWDGDYEDIAVTGKTVYMLRSDGNIFEIENFDKDDRKVTEHKTALSKKNDTEGLAYDKSSNALLIACKGSSSIKKGSHYEGHSAIYKFGLADRNLVKIPYLTVDLNSPDSYKYGNIFKRYSLKNAGKGRSIGSEPGFKPSGLAIQPISDEIYMISNINKILIIMDRQGKVLDFHDLDTKLFRQPEGICFSPSGDLFISSEGDEGAGYILKFNFRKNE